MLLLWVYLFFSTVLYFKKIRTLNICHNIQPVNLNIIDISTIISACIIYVLTANCCTVYQLKISSEY